MCYKRGELNNQISGSEKSFIPIFLRNKGQGKKSETGHPNIFCDKGKFMSSGKEDFKKRREGVPIYSRSHLF